MNLCFFVSLWCGKRGSMKTSEFDYNLPPELIAQTPGDQTATRRGCWWWTA